MLKNIMREFFGAECRFSRVKRPMMADTIFLKTPKRIEALLGFVSIALMFQFIMQTGARYRAMKFPNLPKITYVKRKLENPTYERIVYLLKPFILISDEKPFEISCKVPEIEDYMELFLYLIDAQDCRVVERKSGVIVVVPLDL